ncbi:40S ribosomal protein S15a [Paramecium bursaria]
MVKVNVLNDCLRSIVNAERQGRKQVLIRPVSKLVIKFLQVMQRQGYIGEFEIVDDHRSGKIVVELKGRINKCGVISPRYDLTLGDFEKWTNNILPARQFGSLVLTTNIGILTHEEARQRHVGGKVLGFFY